MVYNHLYREEVVGTTEPFNVPYQEIMRCSWWKLRRKQLKNWGGRGKTVFIGRRDGNVLFILNTVAWNGWWTTCGRRAEVGRGCRECQIWRQWEEPMTAGTGDWDQSFVGWLSWAGTGVWARLGLGAGWSWAENGAKNDFVPCNPPLRPHNSLKHVKGPRGCFWSWF